MTKRDRNSGGTKKSRGGISWTVWHWSSAGRWPRRWQGRPVWRRRPSAGRGIPAPVNVRSGRRVGATAGTLPITRRCRPGCAGKRRCSHRGACRPRWQGSRSPGRYGRTLRPRCRGCRHGGASAAYFYRKQIPQSKVLVIDGCDDFGGHARRNEFIVDGKRLIAGGGTAALWRPNTFPPEAQELLRDIGIDRERYYKEQAETRIPARRWHPAGDVLLQGILRCGPSRAEPTAPELDASAAAGEQRPLN